MILFKSDREEMEFRTKIDPRLAGLILFVAGFVQYHFGKDIVITSLIRKGKGVHGAARGGDMRTEGFTDDELDQIVLAVIKTFPYKYRGRWDVKFSVKDERKEPEDNPNMRWTAPHLHLQTYWG